MRNAPDGLFTRPAVSFLSAAVPVGYNVVHVADEDGIVRKIEKVCLLPQHALRPLALGDLPP